MKRLNPMNMLPVLALVACLATLFVTSTAGCNASPAVQALQFPPAQLAWPAVENDYLRGIADGLEQGDITTDAAAMLHGYGDQLEVALSTASADALRLVPWSALMEEWAMQGIVDKMSDGEIGPTVGEMLREQLDKFTLTIESLQGTH